MKKINITRPVVAALVVCLVMVFNSCKKSSDDDTTTTPPPASSFAWSYNGNNYVASLDTAYQVSVPFTPNAIIAINGTNFNTSYTRKMVFKLSSFSVGSYTIASGGNTLAYIDDSGFDLIGTGGVLTITANANSRLSGNFSFTMTGGPGTFTVTGQFANVSIRP